jgi:4-amino-4-deoxy-L-arabinose transferase-like glycosyltransferase
LSEQAVRAYWDINHEHPPLDKLWSGVVWASARPFVDDLAAHRLGNILLVALGTGALYFTVARSFGAWAGLAAAVALVSMPRFFFHAHLAALDVPAAVAVFLVTALFWHTRRHDGVLWDVALGLAWGAALATKINAAFVLPTLFLWLLLFERRWPLVRRLVVAGLVGLPTFAALWPWLYHQTWERLDLYIRFITVDHWQIGQWYLGRWSMPPPWHFSFVILVAVTPLALLLLALLGVARAVATRRASDAEAREQRAVLGLWALGGLAPLLALSAGQTMVYDNERLFMPTFLFLAALAGAGLDWLWRGIAGRPAAPALRRYLAGVGVVALFVPHLAVSAVLYPHLLSYYSETVGGLAGAQRLGLETTYWCETYAAALPLINARAPRGATVWAETWSHDVLLYYQRSGRLRADLRVLIEPGSGTVLAASGVEGVPGRIGDADYVIVSYRQTGLAVHPDIERWMRGREPLLRVERFGVPLVDLYER